MEIMATNVEIKRKFDFLKTTCSIEGVVASSSQDPSQSTINSTSSSDAKTSGNIEQSTHNAKNVNTSSSNDTTQSIH